MKEMRPTTGKVMQALFNILGPLYGSSFLDLFSGSGQISFEAARRGASPVCSVESERKRQMDIAKRAPDGVKCLCMDARRAAAKLAKNGERFDVVFADPPYQLGWGAELPALIAENEAVVAEGGVFIFEHSVKEAAAEMPEPWQSEERSYGSTVLTFYRRKEEEE